MRGHAVLLVDGGPENRASWVAAGLYNIITGRLAAKTWMAETLLGELNGFFELPEFAHLKPHLHPAEIYRPFRSAFDANEWLGKSGEDKFRGIVDLHPAPRLPEQIHNPDGGLRILPCGRADTRFLIPAIQEVLRESFALEKINAHLDYSTLDPENKRLNIEGKTESYDELIFCDGLGTLNNPYFSWLPLRPLKGQVLDVEIPDFDPGFIVSRKVFIIPVGDHLFLTGSTYEKNYSDALPTPEGREEIESHLQKAIRLPYKVVGQRAGIRPTTPNRRPMLGTHPDYKHLHIFNGLGTKGWLQAPYFSWLMANFVEGDKNCLLKDVNITRFRPK